MPISSMNDRGRRLAAKLLYARREVLRRFPFYGILLLGLPLLLDEGETTAATDGKGIYFSPSFLEKLNERETVFVLLHETLHLVLEHPFRVPPVEAVDLEAYNLAADTIVNSLILLEYGGDPNAIAIGRRPSIHLSPEGKEGREYSLEALYALLRKETSPSLSSSDKEKERRNPRRSGFDDGNTVDSHLRWGSLEEEEAKEAKEKLEMAILGCQKQGNVPLGLERFLPPLGKHFLPWRFLLRDFLEEEVNDYGFLPPDRRYPDSPFFLPSFSKTEERAEGLMFAIDASGSMDDEEVAAAYNEIKGAVEELDNRLEGQVCFFDAEVYGPYPFSSVQDLSKIKPMGGGGTSFSAVFDYLSTLKERPRLLIILTDGQAPFPAKESAAAVSVLWIINNEDITPPWGKVARLIK